MTPTPAITRPSTAPPRNSGAARPIRRLPGIVPSVLRTGRLPRAPDGHCTPAERENPLNKTKQPGHSFEEQRPASRVSIGKPASYLASHMLGKVGNLGVGFLPP